MLAWIKGLFTNKVVLDQVAKLKADLAVATQSVLSAKALKQQLYFYADGILAEGQVKSKDQLDAWFVQKRAELKAWSLQ